MYIHIYVYMYVCVCVCVCVCIYIYIQSFIYIYICKELREGEGSCGRVVNSMWHIWPPCQKRPSREAKASSWYQVLASIHSLLVVRGTPAYRPSAARGAKETSMNVKETY